MTNMTFTKGIGTPAFMAPEVLDKQKYKKPADIYSFSITMYEIFGWGEAYPKTVFKYPWKIAEFVTEGYRQPKTDCITIEEYQLIEKAWEQNPKERLELETMIWGNAFPKTIYRFAWDIADTISSGKRPQTIENVINEEMKQLIEKCWYQLPSDRLSINEILSILKSFLK